MAGEDKTIRDAIASFTGSSATLTLEQQRQLNKQQEVEGGGRMEVCVCMCVCVCGSDLYFLMVSDGNPGSSHSSSRCTG